MIENFKNIFIKKIIILFILISKTNFHCLASNYLIFYPELKTKAGPDPYSYQKEIDLPYCLANHQEDIPYIKEYLLLAKQDEVKRKELIQKMKSNDESFLAFFTKAFDEKKKAGNEKKTYRELLPSEDWIQLAEKTCNEIYRQAGEFHIETYLKGFQSWECYEEGLSEAKRQLFELNFTRISYNGMLALLKCATAEKHCTSEGYWVCYTYGMMRGVVDQLDLLSILDVAKDLIETQYKNKFSCLSDKNGFTLKTQGENQSNESTHLLLKCGLGIDITLKEIEERYALLKDYIEKNWESPYLRGQATIFLATIILPSITKLGTTAKTALISKLENTSILSKEIQTIKALEATEGNLDEIQKIIAKTSNIGNRLFKNIDDFKIAISKGENVFYVGKHSDIVPRPTGIQSHHGVNSVWMESNFSNYIPNDAPSVYMLNTPNHNATRGVFNTWRAEMSKLQGTSKVDYTKITKEEIIKLAERQFDAANVPKIVREEYYKLWEEYLKTLNLK